jgi:undecaprenyl-diphosphatase
MEITDALILGFVEGVTEFLPISSTGHLILTSKFLSLPETSFLSSFEIAIQLGAICAVLFLYGKTLFTNANLFKKIFVAFIPTGIIGITLYPLVKSFLGREDIVLLALFLGGIFLILFELWHKKKIQDSENSLKEISYKSAFIIGFIQTLAFIPGVSRAGATILGGLALGLSRSSIVEFSFLLAVPTMLAATGYDLVSNYKSFAEGDLFLLLIGSFASFITAIFAIQFLMRFIKTHTFIPFGVYRIAISILFFFILFF